MRFISFSTSFSQACLLFCVTLSQGALLCDIVFSPAPFPLYMCQQLECKKFSQSNIFICLCCSQHKWNLTLTRALLEQVMYSLFQRHFKMCWGFFWWTKVPFVREKVKWLIKELWCPDILFLFLFSILVPRNPFKVWTSILLDYIPPEYKCFPHVCGAQCLIQEKRDICNLRSLLGPS